jgi:galactose mutarotase-like enzyme
MDTHWLQLDGREACIASTGAELQSLRLGGLALLWTAGQLWPRHAPLLFPVVGGLKGDALHQGGATFPMPKHGFARNLDFTWISRTDARCVLQLRDDLQTRQAYPFAFRLTIAYGLDATGLLMEVALDNPGDAPLPASFGLHPAFRWPLVPGTPKASHRLAFDTDEPSPLRRLDAAGLLAAEAHPTPIRHRVLPLREELFTDDALIFLEPHSRGVHYGIEGGPNLALRWEGFPHLGIWTKPDPSPSFLCIEPWEGYASLSEWDGEFTEKPGGFVLPPGGTRRWSLSIGLSTS